MAASIIDRKPYTKSALYMDYLLLLASVLILIWSVPDLFFMWEPVAFPGPDAFFTLGSLYFMYTRGRRLYIRRKNKISDVAVIDQILQKEKTVVRSALLSGMCAIFLMAFIPTLLLIGMTIVGIPTEAGISKRAECYAFLRECIQRDRAYLIVLGMELLLSVLVVLFWKCRTIKIFQDRLLFALLFIITFLLSSLFMYDLMFIPAFTIVAMKHGL